MSCPENAFKTPRRKDTKSVFSPCLPLGAGRSDVLSIPASPAMKKLGYGTGVNVFLLERYSPGRGSYGSPWAIKKINSKCKSSSLVTGGSRTSSGGGASPTLRMQPSMSQLWHSRLEEEAKVLRSLHHPNIIGFRGYSTAVDGTKCLMMESGEKDLYTIIEQHSENSSGPLPALHTLAVSRGVASALQYMHEEHHLLHGDIKSANVLIKRDFDQVKLCDFGVCLKLDSKLEAIADQFYVGTECWSPPEVINEDAPVTDKSDIFALGLTIWECVSLEPPHVHALTSVEGEEQLSAEEQDKLSEDRDELFRTFLGTRPPLPPAAASLTGAYLPLLEAFYHCTSERGEQRPSAAMLVTLCDDILEEWGGKAGTLTGDGGECRATREVDAGECDVGSSCEQSTMNDVKGTTTGADDAETVLSEVESGESTVTDPSANGGGNAPIGCDLNTVPVGSKTKSFDDHSKNNKRKSCHLDMDSTDKANCFGNESCQSVTRKKNNMDFKS